MIRLSNGFEFEYVTASGALAYDGNGWPWEWPLRWLGFIDPSLFLNVMKTVTLPPRKGNLRWFKPWDCVQLVRGGTVNAIGLTNPGHNWWAEKIGPKVDSSKIPLVGSIFGEPAAVAIMSMIMNDFDLVALELNASCPNTDDDTLSNSKKVIKSCENVRTTSRHPIWLKLSVAHDAETIVRATQDMVEAFDINSVPWNIAFPNKKSPLEKYGGGGVSGKIAQRFTWPFAEKLQSMTDVPVIAPSVWDFKDISTLRAKGFKAFSFGSVFLRYPWRPTLYAKKDQKTKTNTKGETQ
ncbi:MAG: hypothetical protein ABIJ84_02395 [bacterium]